MSSGGIFYREDDHQEDAPHFRAQLRFDHNINYFIEGAGLLGLYCCGLLSSHAYNVFCCDKNSKRLRLVTEFGAVPLHPSLIGPVESKANYVIECTGDAASAQQVTCIFLNTFPALKLKYK